MWWILLVIVILFLLIAFMPVGLITKYDHAGLKLFIKVGLLRFSLLSDHQGKKKKDGKKTTSPVKKEKKEADEEGGGSLSDFVPIAKATLEFLNQLRKRIVVKNLQFKLTLAGSDPCDLSINYGRTWAAIGALQPQLNRVLRIRKQKIEVQCDYIAEQTTVFCYVDVSISVIRLLQLIATHGTKILDEYNNLKNKRKGGTVYESETSSDA